jgi:hypothetical protein
MTRLVLLLCGALVAVIAVEISFGVRAVGELAPAPAIGPAGQLSRAASRRTDVAPGPLSRGASRRTDADLGRWVAVILNRPLFAPDRRPAPGASTVVAAAGVPRLSGIVVAPGEAGAIFQPKGAKPLVAHPGDVVGGWMVSAIAANGVTLRKADDRITVTPEFDAASATPTHAAVHPGISRWTEAAPSGLLRARWSNPQLQP